MYATRYLSSVCRLGVLYRYVLPVCPPRKRWRGVAFFTYINMLHYTFSVSRYPTLFYNVSTPLRVLCMLVGVAFREIGIFAYKEKTRSRFLLPFSRRLR